MKFLKRGVALALLAAFALASQPAQAYEKDKTYKITILHTNDHHGHFWRSEYGEYGLAAQKTLVDSIRKEVAQEGGSVLLLSGGDINTGVPESDLQDAEPDFRGMNLIGYDAMAVGNHEFDNPLTVLRQQEKWAKFPFLSANIYQKSTGERLFKPWAIFTRQDIKIAVIGLTTDDTAKIGNPEYFTDIEFRKPAEEAKVVIQELNMNEKPDVIIATTHMGHYDNGDHGSNAPGDVEMARSLPAGSLAMIVGGHSQDPVCMASENKKQMNYVPGTPCAPDKQNGIWIVQAHEWGKYVGRADFEFRNGEMKMVNYQLIPVNLKKKVTWDNGKSERVLYTPEIAENPQMLSLLTPFQNKGKAQLEVKIGSVNGLLEGDRSKVRFVQTNMGRVILAAQIARTGADFGVMSGGGIRDSIEAGDITYKSVLKVQPFGNIVVYADMSGKEVVDYLTAVAQMKPDSGAYPQFANVSFVAKEGKLTDLKIKGEPVDPAKTYRMATLSFNATGGDGYPRIDNKPGYVNTGFIDAEVLKEFIQQNSPLDAAAFAPKGEVSWL
ncbi:TPA_asm: bifunctional UDP-sugar hydrolase/5'-nucleotidase [Salmonella enterica subsp. salamae serovar 60:g,m,t:z6]|uniref:Bifunctional UDP-sugar hydrolase/5'-nucleotidase n=1 Tax=Salmonella enterica subsp. houtenae serovar 1,40:z4,z32:- TaxID=1967604 RepID=A0A730WC20_SALHO|nr:bifunctional UDP-sugar hydrolase/5'-nucleotidase UshA [Salmonella enterica]ECF5919455.1 bifunctional UDP-sugar hydrolase/5'-nucleotidase [Salmonella enterica subsp. salamae]HAC6700879.1 bifunctional UDP-sugar hydrolase/5'-nucleotidase [Salmonella bongori serovar 66:z65:-]HAE2269564.1 bifunctional UDP-sugar hydrolase/5'-nucleotidase [Salmonella enterica subsp. enterica serovar 1,9,12:-:-]HAE4191175.1 bifunctional UDP-sugar hydrolase/5'-nucleotidase [Salmonella enterica subsp. houtenae serovar